MKNKIIWASGLFLGLAFGFWTWSRQPALPLEQVLPCQPMVFAQLRHVQQQINQAVNSDIGKNIASINFSDVLSRNNFSAKDIADFRHWQKDMKKFWGNPLTKRLLAKEAAVAIYRNRNSYEVFVVLRLTLSTKIAESFGHLFNHWGDDVAIRRQSYSGMIIDHIVFQKEGLHVAYVRIGDLVVLAPEPLTHLEEVVDVYRHKHDSLGADPSFNFIRRNAYPKGEGLLFVNFNLLSNFWRGEADSRLTPLGYQAQAFPVYGLSYMPGVISKYKMMVAVDKNHMPSGMLKVLDYPALADDTLRFVPSDAIFYAWGCYDFGQSWTALKQRLQEQNPELTEKAAALKKRFEKHFQIDIRKDMLPLLGHEIGGYLTDVDMQATYPFPLPRFLVFVKIQNIPAAERLLDKIVQGSIVVPKNEEYQQVAIHYVSSSLGANMDPGYAFLGDYLLVATSRQLLKKSIDAYHDSLRSMVSDEAVEQFSLGTGQKFHSVTLLKTAELSRRAQDFLGWLDKYLSDRVNMAAAYKQDGDNRKHELDQAIADKNAELVLARKKLTQLKSTSLMDAAIENPSFVNGAIDNLNREELAIQNDIANYREQKQDLARLLENYAVNAQSDKLAMYNMDSIVSPVLKGLESINAQAVTVRFDDQILETEFLVK